jgi:hypothetical protein
MNQERDQQKLRRWCIRRLQEDWTVREVSDHATIPKWAQILKEPHFKDWLTNLSHSNPGTAKDMRRKFHVIYEVLGKSPQDLASMTEGQAQTFLIHLVDLMAKVGLKGHKHRNPQTGKMENKPEPLRHNTMVSYVNAVRTWLQHFRFLRREWKAKRYV